MRASVVKAADAFLYAGVGLGGYRNLYGAAITRPAPPLTHKKSGSNTRLTPSNILQAEIRVIPAFFIGR